MASIPQNTWLHIAAIFTNNAYYPNQIYINGVRQPLSQILGGPIVRSVTPEANMVLDLTLPQANPALTVKLVNGESHVLDLGTSQFGYYIVLSGYARFDNANLCLPDGSTIAPSKNDIAKIVGPATSVNFSPCCTRGPVLTLNVELKSGQKSQMYLVDSCYDNELDFIGRERSTAQWMYLNLNNIAEIDFP